MKNLLLLLLVLFCGLTAKTQNSGTDFFIGYVQTDKNLWGGEDCLDFAALSSPVDKFIQISGWTFAVKNGFYTIHGYKTDLGVAVYKVPTGQATDKFFCKKGKHYTDIHRIYILNGKRVIHLYDYVKGVPVIEQVGEGESSLIGTPTGIVAENGSTVFHNWEGKLVYRAQTKDGYWTTKRYR